MRIIIVIAVITITIFIIFSCKTYKLSKNDLEWQPYKIGDTLIFESNQFETDTIVIKTIEIHSAAVGPLDIFPNIIQTLYVSGCEGGSILEMEASNKGVLITFSLNELGNDFTKYPTTVFEIKKLIKMQAEENTNYKIKAEEYYDNMKKYQYDLQYFYWSKNYGYLSFEFKNNYLWRLKSFIRNGKNII